jgi:hypothetical protein
MALLRLRVCQKNYILQQILKLGETTKSNCLQLEKGDLITPMARDIAREMSLRLYEPGETPPNSPPSAIPMARQISRQRCG